MTTLPFTVTHRDTQTKARTGLLETAHGVVETPVFMPVGTLGSVKGLTQEQLDVCIIDEHTLLPSGLTGPRI